MSSREDREQRLADVIDSVLRTQPPRSAPATLEARVLAEIASRATRPWWARGFVTWPAAARIAFVLASVGFAKVVLIAGMYVLAGLRAVPRVLDLAPEVALLRSIASMGASIAHSIPALWLYGPLLVIASAYVLLFALGATGYRTLYARR